MLKVLLAVFLSVAVSACTSDSVGATDSARPVDSGVDGAGAAVHKDSGVDGAAVHKDSGVDGTVVHKDSGVDGTVVHKDSGVDGAVVHKDSGVDGAVRDSGVGAAVPPSTPSQALSLSWVQHSHGSLVLGLLLSLLLWAANAFGLKKRVPPKYIPWLAASLGMAATISQSLLAGVQWQHALTQGFTAGAVAVGLWEMVFRHFGGPPVQS